MKIQISTDDYVAAHGKKPRGKGMWAFTFGVAGSYTAQPNFYNGSYSEAKKQAIKDARAMSCDSIIVGS